MLETSVSLVTRGRSDLDIRCGEAVGTCTSLERSRTKNLQSSNAENNALQERSVDRVMFHQNPHDVVSLECIGQKRQSDHEQMKQRLVAILKVGSPDRVPHNMTPSENEFPSAVSSRQSVCAVAVPETRLCRGGSSPDPSCRIPSANPPRSLET